MNYFKYLLFAILSYSFIHYQYFLRPETIIEIVIGNTLIFFVLEYIILHKYSLDLPFIKNKKEKNKKEDDSESSENESENSDEKSRDSLIDNESLELLINEQDEINQSNRPPYLNY
jgi:hypothetical protein